MVIGPIRHDSDRDTRRLAATEASLYFSQLTEEYGRFNRGLFIETLNDWGWFGPEGAEPDRYTGEAWG